MDSCDKVNSRIATLIKTRKYRKREEGRWQVEGNHNNRRKGRKGYLWKMQKMFWRERKRERERSQRDTGWGKGEGL